MLKYVDEAGAKGKLHTHVTFADFAATEGRFSKHFRKAPPETWNDSMVPLAELVSMPADERDGLFPYIWATDAKGRLMRLVVAQELVKASEERLQFWRQLKDVVGKPPFDEAAVAERARADLTRRLSASLSGLGLNLGAVAPAPAPALAAPAPTPAPAPAAAALRPQRRPPAVCRTTSPSMWIRPIAPPATSASEQAPGVFAYNAEKLAIVTNPKGAKYADIVKSAETLHRRMRASGDALGRERDRTWTS